MELDSWIQFVGYFGAIEIGTEKHMSNMQWSLSSYWILPFFWNCWILCQFFGPLMHMPCGIFRQCQYIISGTNLSAKTVNTFWKMSIMTIAKLCKIFCCCDIYIPRLDYWNKKRCNSICFFSCLHYLDYKQLSLL